MPLVQTRGAASAQGFGEFAQATAANYIEDVFSTYLVTGDGSAPAVNNGIDVSGKGGLVWTKKRSASGSHDLFDTARGANLRLISNDTAAQDSKNLSFTSTGFSNYIFDSGVTYVSWTFRKQPKFFDVVTYTGDNVIGREIPHNLGSVPGCIMVKQTNATRDWVVYHVGIGNTKYLTLNSTSPAGTQSFFNNTSPTSTNFTVGDWGAVNQAGSTYVAYLFAHDAGGFGLTGTDNVISCGSVTADGAGSATVNLGYEPQWLLVKSSSEVNSWAIVDTMRGLPADGSDRFLFANSSAAESGGGLVNINATGFYANATLSASATYIYIAIRRGPMKVPTVGTSVFESKTMSATQANLSITGVGFPPDLVINGVRSNANYGQQVTDRLRGVTKQVFTEYNSAENTTDGTAVVSLNMNGISLGADTGGTGWNAYSGYTSVKWMFGRAPSFFDAVCYTGTGSNTTFTHNLTVVPELIIVKRRDTTGAWDSYSSALANTEYVVLNTTAAKATGATRWNSTTPTSSVFSVGTSTTTNASAGTYVAYLFATCAGVSKVGSYTGNGSTQTIDCGFGAGGARFVLIKRTDAAGDWYVYDTARGMTVLTNPYSLLNTTAAEVATLGSVTTVSTGFALDSTILAAINASAGTYIFLAIA